MGERIRDALRSAGDGVRELLERTYAQEEPGRFRPALAGLTPAGSGAGLTPSCLALRISRSLGLWDLVDKDEQAAWIAYIGSFQRASAGDEPALEGAFLDPEVAESARPGEGRATRWARGRGRESDPLVDLARSQTRRAVAALACVDAYPVIPYRALPTEPASLQAELKRSDWRDPVGAAARSGDLIALAMSQGRHFLELTQLHLLREVAAAWYEALCDRETGAFFPEKALPRPELLAVAAHALDAFDWLGRPPPRPAPLIDLCLASAPGRDCDPADWARVLHHCLRHSDHRRSELAAPATEVLGELVARRASDGGWSLRPEGMATHDGPLEISDGRAGSDLFGTERAIGAVAMLAELLEWDAPRWLVLRR
jgi:hypothetical protein